MVKIKVQNIEPSQEEIVKEEIQEDESPETLPEMETKPLKQTITIQHIFKMTTEFIYILYSPPRGTQTSVLIEYKFAYSKLEYCLLFEHK